MPGPACESTAAGPVLSGGLGVVEVRSWNDLQALAMRELSGEESPGTVVSILTGAPIPTAPAETDHLDALRLHGDSIQALMDYVSRVAADKSTKAYFLQLAAKSDEVKKLQADLAQERAALEARHQERLVEVEKAKLAVEKYKEDVGHDGSARP
jgi:hypothetical protein